MSGPAAGAALTDILVEPPNIRIVAGQLHEMATKGETALIKAGAPLYVRGTIVRPIVDEMQAAHGRRTRVARLAEVTADMLVDHLSRSAHWEKFYARTRDWISADVPRNVATTILSRDGEWRLPPLAGVTTTPTLRPDGTILSTPGYDRETRLLLMDPPEMPPMKSNPAKADAEQSLAVLESLLVGFPFVDDASRSVALSGLITPVVRGAMPVAPLHTNTAPVAGSGKSFIVDIASAILTGDRAPVIAAGRTEEETEKRLGAALLQGLPIVSIDNVNGTLGGDMLCQMIERPVVSVRPLGVSRLVRIESRATIFATGNNIQLVGDMTRRAMLCSLDPNMERPELRTFAFDPFDEVTRNRGRYVAAALTITSAYMRAGCPGALPPLASFAEWSNIVRSALVWLGRADPVDTMAAARKEDPITTSLGAVLRTWHKAVGEGPRSTGWIKEIAEAREGGELANGDFFHALIDVAEDKRGAAIDTRRLGVFLSRHQRRVLDGLKLRSVQDGHAKQQLWSVVAVGGDAGSAG